MATSQSIKAIGRWFLIFLALILIVIALVGVYVHEIQEESFVWAEYGGIHKKGGWLGNAAVELRGSKPGFIAVTKAGVEVLTDEGWEVLTEVWHGETRKLGNGEKCIVWVEPPNYEIWRAYVHYSLEKVESPWDKFRKKWAKVVGNTNVYTGRVFTKPGRVETLGIRSTPGKTVFYD